MVTSDTKDGASKSWPVKVSRRGLIAGGLAATAAGMVGVPIGGAAAENLDHRIPGHEPKVLRTPEERFRDLKDYPFSPHYVTVDSGDDVGTQLRVHYIDERPSDASDWSGETILLLHGEPAWSYLYRHVIPPLVAAGHRCVAPDLVGFGKSDKLVDRFTYTYQGHVDWLREAVFDRLGLHDVTMVCHDWGGKLGLRLLADHPDRFRRVVASNTDLETGDEDLGDAWPLIAQWLQLSQRERQFEPGHVVEMFTATELDPAERAAYNAPYPDDRYLKGVRRFPLLIPITGNDENTPALRAAWAVLETLHTPFLCAFSDGDHASGGDHSALSARIPGARDRAHPTITDAAHFLQEDQAPAFASVINDFIRSTA